MGTLKRLPVGTEDFAKIRTEDCYFVDKTGWIKELLESWTEVNLFTRPRRFGKSLNMNMLRYFLEYGCDSRLFEGLAIGQERELCQKYMGKFPVISITLKGVDARRFDLALEALISTIAVEAMRFPFLAGSDKLTDEEQEQYRQLVKVDTSGQSAFIMSERVLRDSLLTLSRLLCKHYGQKVVLLIDEYDVPLARAQHFGYYDEMVDVIRSLFGQMLKTNESLYFAVLTGCLKIAKESIFTGLNNLRVLTITDRPFSRYFGFLDGEVRQMLEYYGFGDKYELMKKWYDGYRFGNTDVYCPWDVVNYCADLRADAQAVPKAFWINTSGNDIIRTFLQTAGASTRREIEELVNGGSVTRKIRQELTYRDLYKDIDNLWSVLFTTGYLTQRGEAQGDELTLAIPNLEIRKIFAEQILEWFQEEAVNDTPKLDAFCDAFARGDAEGVEESFNAYLQKTISIRDTGAGKGRKEHFYHGILLGLLSHCEDWYVRSNVESGEGFSDILVEIEGQETGLVIEVKYAEDGNLEAGCRDALAQIEEKNYKTRLEQEGMTTIYKYGIACWKKRCQVRVSPVYSGSNVSSA